MNPFSSPTITYAAAVKIANAAGRDAANRAMRDGGRKAWNEDDRDCAVDACNAVLGGLGFGHLTEG